MKIALLVVAITTATYAQVRPKSDRCCGSSWVKRARAIAGGHYRVDCLLASQSALLELLVRFALTMLPAMWCVAVCLLPFRCRCQCAWGAVQFRRHRCAMICRGVLLAPVLVSHCIGMQGVFLAFPLGRCPRRPPAWRAKRHVSHPCGLRVGLLLMVIPLCSHLHRRSTGLGCARA